MPSQPEITEATIVAEDPPIVGQTITAEATVTGDPAPVITYQWQRSNNNTSWHNLNNETAQTHTLAEGETHRYIRVVITATNNQGSDTLASASIGPILHLPEAAVPTLEGEAKIGETITTTAEFLAGYPEPEMSIVWQRSTDGSTWYNTQNTTDTYTVTELDIGKLIRSAVTATNEVGEDTKTSIALGPVSSRNFTKSTVLPTANGYLLQVLSGESVGVEYDSEFNPNEEAQVKWVGVADALLKIKTRVNQSGGIYDSYKEIIVLLPYIVDLKKSDRLKIRYRGTESFYEIAEIDVLDLDLGLPEGYKCYIIEK